MSLVASCFSVEVYHWNFRTFLPWIHFKYFLIYQIYQMRPQNLQSGQEGVPKKDNKTQLFSYRKIHIRGAWNSHTLFTCSSTKRIVALPYTSLSAGYSVNNITLLPSMLYIYGGYNCISFCSYLKHNHVFLKKNRKQCPLKAFCFLQQCLT